MDRTHAGASELFAALYEELRRLASRSLRSEWSGRSLQTTALVHQAFQRLAGSERVYESRAAFFFDAARAMRRILVDEGRRRRALKRGGGTAPLPISADADPQGPGLSVEDIVALDEALIDLQRLEPRQAAIVELRFFAGLTIAETAGVLGVAQTTVENDWRFAKLWLRSRLRGEGAEPAREPRA